MESIWRKHLITCLLLLLLPVPIYLLSLPLSRGRVSGDWIKIDFRAFFFWTYIIWLAVHVALTSIAILSFPGIGALRIHLVSMLVSLFLVFAGFVTYSKLHDRAIARQYRIIKESRRPRIDVIELKKWWYVPDEIHPTEIRVSVFVRESGRFTGNVLGEGTDSSGSSTTVFQSLNQPENQRLVASGESFTFGLPLEFLHAAAVNDVRITLYLFKAPSGPANGDITKVFISSPEEEDDGQYFYGVLPAPSQPADR